MIVRRTGLDWRPVSGSVATRVMTFEPGRSSTRIENAPVPIAVAVGFSRRPSTVIWASGTVSPRRTYDVPAYAARSEAGSVRVSSGVPAKVRNW